MNLKINEQNKDENSTQYVYRILRENILNLNLSPGEAINENDISKALSLSRSPIRSALIQLKGDDLIHVFPQKGTFVTLFNEDIIREAWFAREILEIKILEKALEEIRSKDIHELEKILNFQKIISEFECSPLEFFNSDNQFHEYIYKIANKNNIWKKLYTGSTHLNRLRLLDAIQGEHIKEIINDHEIILKMLKNRKKEEIEPIIKKHFSDYERQIVKAKTNFPHYFS